MTIAISGTTGITLDGQFNSASSMGFKNRIINGAMVIDQRNVGAAVTITGGYPVDRFLQAFSGGEVAISGQQDSSAPTGFVNSTKITITTAEVSVGADDRVAFQQRIEGTNVADLAWGTANAKTVTLSFWVRSSLTGTFGGALRNSANNRSYPFTYSISVADTWEYKTVTISGDTTGTWLTTTGIGIVLNFSLMAGTNFAGTAGAWASAGYQGATGQVQLATTLNATWYVTGVQLEKGSTATSFDYRPYGTELQLCQRYYFRIIPASGNFASYGSGVAEASSAAQAVLKYPVTMRASPTISQSSTRAYNGNGSGYAVTGLGVVYTTFDTAAVTLQTSSLTIAQGVMWVAAGTTSSYVDASAEL